MIPKIMRAAVVEKFHEPLEIRRFLFLHPDLDKL
jgi:hypothetical protein